MNLDYLATLIDKVYEEDDRSYFRNRFDGYVELCKVRPVERSLVYPTFRKKIVELIENIPLIAD
jgi:hypothetical protein